MSSWFSDHLIGCLTECAFVVASVFVVLLCHDLTITESRVKVWRL